MNTTRVPVSGDPFYAAACHHEEPWESRCLCWDGWAYLRYMTPEEPGGGEVEITYRVPC